MVLGSLVVVVRSTDVVARVVGGRVVAWEDSMVVGDVSLASLLDECGGCAAQKVALFTQVPLLSLLQYGHVPVVSGRYKTEKQHLQQQESSTITPDVVAG